MGAPAGRFRRRRLHPDGSFERPVFPFLRLDRAILRLLAGAGSPSTRFLHAREGSARFNPGAERLEIGLGDLRVGRERQPALVLRDGVLVEAALLGIVRNDDASLGAAGLERLRRPEIEPAALRLAMAVDAVRLQDLERLLCEIVRDAGESVGAG